MNIITEPQQSRNYQELINKKKNIFVIIGSASSNSANLKLVEQIATLTTNELNLTIYNDLKSLPLRPRTLDRKSAKANCGI